MKQDALTVMVERAQAGDLRARNAVVTANMRLVTAIARKLGRGLPEHVRDDLEQQGAMGLIRAVETWNPKGETAWKTHAGWKVKNAIRKARMGYQGIKVKSHQHLRLAALIGKAQIRREALGLPCGPEDLAQELGVRTSTVLEYLQRRSCCSLDTVAGDGLTPLVERVAQDTFPLPGEAPDREADEAEQDRWTKRIRQYAERLPGLRGEILRANLAGESMAKLGARIGVPAHRLNRLAPKVYRLARLDLEQRF